MSEQEKDKTPETSPPLRRMFKVLDGQTGQETRHVAEGTELKTRPEPKAGVKDLTDPTVWPGPPENWW